MNPWSVYLTSRPTFLSVIRPHEIELFRAHLPFTPPVLDFGCGDGFLTGLISPQSKIDVGLETDPARAHLATQSGVYKRVLVYEGQTIPLPTASVSTVISNSVMEHVTDPDLAFKQIYRILRKNGLFYVSITTKNYETNLLGSKLFGHKYITWMNKHAYHHSLQTSSELISALTSVGFKLVSQTFYLDRRNTQLLDLMHYQSLPGIMAQRLKWTSLANLYWRLSAAMWGRFIQTSLTSDQASPQATCVFLVFKK